VPIQRHPSPIRANFTILRNSTLEDARLSWEARGLLAYLLSKPDNWVVNTRHLTTQSPSAKKEKILKILAELERFGYLAQCQDRDTETGAFEQVKRIVFDTPHDIIPDGTATCFAGSGDAGSGDTVSGDAGRIVSTDKEQELSRTRTESSILPVPPGTGGSSPDGPTSDATSGGDSGRAPKPKPFLAEFEEVWAAYPRKIGRKKAYDQFVTRMRAGHPFAEIREAVSNYAGVRRGQDSAFTLHPATFWGPAERWKDYLDGGEGLRTTQARPKGFTGIEDFLQRGE